VSFQQIQKYEKAANRAPGSRLIQIARALDVPAHALRGDDAETTQTEVAPQLAAVSECQRRLMGAASKIADPQFLKLIAELVERLAKP
jgi:hypothetical protein